MKFGREMLRYCKEIISVSGIGGAAIAWLFVAFVFVGVFEVLGLAFVAVFVGGLLDVPPPLGVLGVFDFQIDVISLSVGLVVIFGVKALAGVGVNYFVFRTAAIVEADLKLRLLRAYQSMPYSSFSARDQSNYITAITTWAPQFSGLVFLNLLKISAEILIGLFIFAFVFSVSPVGISSLFLIVGSMLAVYFLGLKEKNAFYSRLYKGSSVDVVTVVKQALAGFKEIRSMQAEAVFSGLLEHSSLRMASAQARSSVISNSARYFLELGIVVFIVFFVFLLSENSLLALIPTLAVFAASAMRIVSLFGLLNVGLTQLSFNRRIVRALFEDLRFESMSRTGSNLKHVHSASDQLPGDPDGWCLCLEHASFKYPGANEELLSDVNLEIKAGDKIAIVGPSGAGKSTLLDLILGYVEPTSGTVSRPFVGDIGSARGELRFTYIPQSTFMVSGSVADNILFNTAHELSGGDVQDAIRLAEIDFLGSDADWARDVGDSGCELSGGQRQRVALARAILQCSGLLVLDEATNAVDADKERAIIENLTDNLNCAVIWVTHREEYTKYFDRIYVVEGGRVAERES